MDSAPEPNDVFSLSDQLLAERLQFVKEIGFGNWGSVWLCRPKSSSGKHASVEVAVKLVHRSKTPTTAARVRSLWNEMKIVRSFKHDPHPSIIPFHSFIITPSYALITMAYLPTLVPVEVSEPRAKHWFRSLLSGVHFLHSRGVVHNDIKPANILLSPANVPVLVDFGFAEKYDLQSPKAFHSNLAYGTPEYLSPERARGMPHDTRKSDVWSLGITFFEILVGRTPFEYEEGEVFEKKEDLERYWERTMRGKWVGTYSVSNRVERFLKRMVVPNADLRCTAADLMVDAYWEGSSVSVDNVKTLHKKSTSAALLNNHSRLHSSSLFATLRDHSKEKLKEKDKDTSISRLPDIPLPWSNSKSTSRPSSITSRTNSHTGLASRSVSRTGTTSRAASPNNNRSINTNTTDSISAHIRSHALHIRSKSQPKLRTPARAQATSQGRKLSTVQASPIVKMVQPIDSETETSHAEAYRDMQKREHLHEHTATPKKLVSLRSVSSLRRPLGPRQPSPRSVTASASKTAERMIHLQEGTTKAINAAGRNASPVHAALFPPTPRTPQVSAAAPAQTSASKQLSGKPPRSRSRARVLADLTGFARNVDLSAHGVVHTDKNRPGEVSRGARERERDDAASPAKGRDVSTSKKSEDKENIGTRAASAVHGRSRGFAEKENASKVPFATPDHLHSYQSQSPFEPQAKSTPKDHEVSTESALDSLPVLANLSTATTGTKGSVRDRMMDWERERARLREMNRASTVLSGSCSSSSLASTSASGTEADLDSDSDSDSEVEAEVMAEANSAVSKPQSQSQPKASPNPVGSEVPAIRDISTISTPAHTVPMPMRTLELTRTRSELTTHTTTTVVSSTSGLAASTLTGESENREKGEIEVAKLGVRAPAQILASRNGSLSVVALGQTFASTGQVTEVRRPSEEEPDKSVGDDGLPMEVRRPSESALSGFKHSVKASIDKGVRMCKSSTLAQLAGRTTPVWCATPEPMVPLDFESRRSGEGRFSWEDIRPEEEIALDRMNMWIQSVERVVEETRQNFASTSVTQPPALPLAPATRSSSQNQSQSNQLGSSQNTNANNTGRSSRLPRRHIPANQIFAELDTPDAPLSPASQEKSMSFSYIDMPESSCPVLPSLSVLAQTPRRQRRATISTPSPAPERSRRGEDNVFDAGTPSKKREKSRSIGNLDRHIRDVAKLELELNADIVSKPSAQRLSAVLDRSLFVATPVAPKCVDHCVDDLTASPFHVEPYPQRNVCDDNVPASPERRRLEGVYDRFLMATTGVKRVGKGYQSDNFKPVQHAAVPGDTTRLSSSQSRTFGVFGSSKRQMPPPVSSDDIWHQSSSINELGFGTCGAGIVPVASRAACKEDSKNTVTLVRRAIKLMVPGKTVSRRALVN